MVEALRPQGLRPRPDFARAIDVLRRQEMPLEEIHVLVVTDDPTLVRRYLELHRERLDEWLAVQARCLWAVERLLTEAASQRRRRRLDTGSVRPDEGSEHHRPVVGQRPPGIVRDLPRVSVGIDEDT